MFAVGLFQPVAILRARDSLSNCNTDTINRNTPRAFVDTFEPGPHRSGSYEKGLGGLGQRPSSGVGDSVMGQRDDMQNEGLDILGPSSWDDYVRRTRQWHHFVPPIMPPRESRDDFGAIDDNVFAGKWLDDILSERKNRWSSAPGKITRMLSGHDTKRHHLPTLRHRVGHQHGTHAVTI